MTAGDWFIIIYIAMAIFGIAYAAVLAFPEITGLIRNVINKTKKKP